MDYITELKDNEIFVFGSNEAGIHGAGAAKRAIIWGAEYGKGFGLQGRTFAIPTKNNKIKTLPINKIDWYVSLFIDFAKEHPELTFLVTPIGTGLAGYKDDEIAPLFVKATYLDNVVLPDSFKELL